MDYQKEMYSRYNARTAMLDPAYEEKLTWFRFYFNEVYKFFFQDLPKDTKILEIGCNKGFLLKILHEQGFTNLYGVDLSSGDLDIARQTVPQADLSYEDAFDYLDKRKDFFDLILSKAVIEHIKKDKILIFLQKIHESLRAQGSIFIDVYNADWIFAFHERYMDFTHEIGFTQESLHQVMGQFFSNVRVIPTASPPYRLGRKDYIKHRIAKKIVFSLLFWAQPELQNVDKRILIASGTK